MDTRDQTLTKLTQLHDKSHPTHYCPASLRWNYSRTAVSIMKLVMEDGWWWRRRRIPLSGAPKDSRSALPRGFRAWWQLRIVKRDDFFSLIFSPWNTIYGGGVGVGESTGGHEGRGRALGGQARPHPRGEVVAPWPSSFAGIFLIFWKVAPWSFKSF